MFSSVISIDAFAVVVEEEAVVVDDTVVCALLESWSIDRLASKVWNTLFTKLEKSVQTCCPVLSKVLKSDAKIDYNRENYIIHMNDEIRKV